MVYPFCIVSFFFQRGVSGIYSLSYWQANGHSPMTFPPSYPPIVLSRATFILHHLHLSKLLYMANLVCIEAIASLACVSYYWTSDRWTPAEKIICTIFNQSQAPSLILSPFPMLPPEKNDHHFVVIFQGHIICLLRRLTFRLSKIGFGSRYTSCFRPA